MTTFDQLLGEHRRANIEGEIAAVIGAFTESMLSAFGADDPGATMRENLDQFEAELDAALPKWAAGEGVFKSVPIEPIRKMRDGIGKVLRDAGEDVPETPTRKESPMEATDLLKTRAAVTAAIGVKAEEIRKRDGVSQGVARMRAWEELPHLAKRYEELPHEAPSTAPVHKAGTAMQEATTAATALMKNNPGKYKSVSSARVDVYKIDPELADRVRREA